MLHPDWTRNLWAFSLMLSFWANQLTKSLKFKNEVVRKQKTGRKILLLFIVVIVVIFM